MEHSALHATQLIGVLLVLAAPLPMVGDVIDGAPAAEGAGEVFSLTQ